MPCALPRVVLVVAAGAQLLPAALSLDNGAALRPPRGFNAWNGFKMNFNATVMSNTAKAMKANGMLAAGYDLLTLGGSTYLHQAIPPWNRTGNGTEGNVIVRNSSGHVQIDPARFPGPGSSPSCLDPGALAECLGGKTGGKTPEQCGCANGNEGLRKLVGSIRALGFKWGSYSNMAGCQVAACDTPALASSAADGFIRQDAAVYLDEWQSDYLMVDSVGVTPPAGADRHAWQRRLIGGWGALFQNYSRPVVFHSCHSAGCGGVFSGPTLTAAPCASATPVSCTRRRCRP